MQEVKVPIANHSEFERYLTQQGIPHTVKVNDGSATFKSQQSLKMFWHTFKKLNHIRQGENNGRSVLFNS